MHPHQQEENDAWFSRQDRFDGFDRGDLDRDHEADQKAEAEEMCAKLVIDFRAEIEKIQATIAPRFSFVAYTVDDFNPIMLEKATGTYRVFGDEIAYFADPAKARKLANLFGTQKVRCGSANFNAWKAARIDYLKGMIDRLSQ